MRVYSLCVLSDVSVQIDLQGANYFNNIQIIYCNIQIIFISRPKILTEFGNLILESALDANINIRLRGSGAFQINGVTLSTLMQSMKNGNATVASVGQDVSKHLSDIDMAVLAIQAHFAGQNSIQARLRRLENR